MRWFKHFSDSHTNGKMRQILRDKGLEGYAICWVLREMVAKEGSRFRIKKEKDWKTTASEILKKSPQEVDSFLQYFAKINAICPKSLKDGDLYIPKMRDYADNYCKYVKSDFKDALKQLTPEEKRIEEEKKKNRTDILELFKLRHKEVTGVPYPVSYAKDKSIIKNLSELYDFPILTQLVETFFKSAKDPNVWWSDKLNLRVFSGTITQIIGKIRKEQK